LRKASYKGPGHQACGLGTFFSIRLSVGSIGTLLVFLAPVSEGLEPSTFSYELGQAQASGLQAGGAECRGSALGFSLGRNGSVS
jgi:hypothetical protein